MADRNEVYKCDPCGNIVEVVFGGPGELVCCGEAMKLLEENTVDAASEMRKMLDKSTSNWVIKYYYT